MIYLFGKRKRLLQVWINHFSNINNFSLLKINSNNCLTLSKLEMTPSYMKNDLH